MSLGFSYPAEVLSQLAPHLQSPGFCVLIDFTAWTGLALSAVYLTMLNIDKIVCFRFPLHYLRLTDKCAVAVSIVLAVACFG